MIVFVFGSRGMAGHMIANYLKSKTDYEVFTSSRESPTTRNHYQLDVENTNKVMATLNEVKPDVIINCIGILNDKASQNQQMACEINGVFPHRLAQWADDNNAKIIQISTDCVYAGKKGNYAEMDKPDGTTMYAVSKRLGELDNNRDITIRTSIIGPELRANGIGLFQWFMKQKGEVYGFQNVRWNGVTTLELAKVIHAFIQQQITGLYHFVAPQTITKYDLLKLIQSTFYKNDVTILPADTPVLDRTLKNTRTDFHYETPNYEKMLAELKAWMKQGGD